MDLSDVRGWLDMQPPKTFGEEGRLEWLNWFVASEKMLALLLDDAKKTSDDKDRMSPTQFVKNVCHNQAQLYLAQHLNKTPSRRKMLIDVLVEQKWWKPEHAPSNETLYKRWYRTGKTHSSESKNIWEVEEELRRDIGYGFMIDEVLALCWRGCEIDEKNNQELSRHYNWWENNLMGFHLKNSIDIREWFELAKKRLEEIQSSKADINVLFNKSDLHHRLSLLGILSWNMSRRETLRARFGSAYIDLRISQILSEA